MSSLSDPVLHAMRHSCAHLMAAAVHELWPAARFGVGPAIADGFYYDVEFPEPVVEDDLARIEQRMREIQARDEPFVAHAWPVQRALVWMRAHDQVYKAELIELLREQGSTAASQRVDDDVAIDVGLDEVGVCSLGAFTDLCKGPHVASARAIGPFKLTSFAGAYWQRREAGAAAAPACARPRRRRSTAACAWTWTSPASACRRRSCARSRPRRPTCWWWATRRPRPARWLFAGATGSRRRAGAWRLSRRPCATRSAGVASRRGSPHERLNERRAGRSSTARPCRNAR